MDRSTAIIDNFANELGNVIQLKVTRCANSVIIRLCGPTSEAVNVVTVQEAHHIHAALGGVLNPPHHQGGV